MTIDPYSWVGFAVLAIFTLAMLAIVFETQLAMDKFKPALMMLSALVLIGLHYRFSGNDPERWSAFLAMQRELETGLFSLVMFMAFTWMIVELLQERGVFSALNGFLARRGLGPQGLFWATGALSAVLSPFINNITTAMIFGKSIQGMSANRAYTHVALCNIVVASNSGVWFLGTATTLMIVLAGKISLTSILLLLPAALIGWVASALVLQFFYLNRIEGTMLRAVPEGKHLKRGGGTLLVLSLIAVLGAVLLHTLLHVALELALGAGLGMIVLFTWYLKQRGESIPLLVQLQKVEWNTLLFFVGIVAGVAALSHAGWLRYLTRSFEILPPTWVNIILGLTSGVLDNVPVEAAALLADPALRPEQWALNALLIGIGGSLTVIGSAAGVMAMSMERTYTFAAHLKFFPALAVNFLASIGVWYLQSRIFGWG